MKLFNLRYGRQTHLLTAAIMTLSSITYGTSCSADQSNASAQNTAPTLTTEHDVANQKVDQSRLKLEQARRQLAAAKALVKAAQAEYKAAQVDRDALELRNQAQKLAAATQASPTPNTQPPEVLHNNGMVNIGNSRLQGWNPALETNKSPVQGIPLSGAPAPSIPLDLKPDSQAPQSVP